MQKTKYLLPYTPPYDWAWMSRFLSARALAGIESFEQGVYRRTIEITEQGVTASGWLSWRPLEHEGTVELEVSDSLEPHIQSVVRRVRHLLDLDANPQLIAETLGLFGDDVAGMRMPGCIDNFELTVRAILGQLVSVKMAATFCARLAELCGEPVVTPFTGLTRLFPTAQRVASLSVEQLRAIGVQAKRAACLIGVAQAVQNGELPLYGVEDSSEGIKRLVAMPGIGAWTANYVAMRAWGERDIFLHSDYLIKQRFPNMTPATISRYAEIWKPWRSYATLLIWNNPNWKP
ncbi:DNA-3-methyladenine glycosylase 2 [Serratia sp. M24T3]|uniref:DNA-3-methyladenine glycosylase 2 n=1 Tax=Serratia sp. M24T3 TaxID=932213 RepID=UPI00025B91DA|nr:DNA-3-methyladenine glycosylase 2 [Serratia sp. M24T3]EIC83029.1 DNA-3-methyladenine glycosylase II [Serratia sp. M24T3]